MKVLHPLRLLTLILVLFAFPSGAGEPVAREGALPLTELRNFVQAFEQIRQAYVEEIDDKTLLENALQGMLASLDPHSVYLNEESLESLEEHTTGKFGGLGIEVGMEDGYVKVISPIDDTPAQKAGILAGDLIIKIDGQLIRGIVLQDAIELMRGEKGTVIELEILRKGAEKPIAFSIMRDIIEVKSVRSKILEPGFGYVRIAQFQENTGVQFRDALQALSKNPLSGLILDLRNNPGGLLNASLEVVDAVLSEGLIVYTEGRIPDAKTRFKASPGDLLNGIPIVLLINSGSASASEIVAGALQDHHRAIIAGTQSFGKGSVQTVLPLDDNRAIKLTTARYFTPSGRSIQAEGILPDIEIKPAEIHFLDEGGYIQEKNLSRHLENPQAESSTAESGENDIDDNQLRSALNLLKGAVLLQTKTGN